MKMEKLKEYLLNLNEVLKKEEEENKDILKRKNVLLIILLKRPLEEENQNEEKYNNITGIVKMFQKNSSITNLNLSYSKGNHKYLVLSENYTNHNIFFHIEIIYYDEKKKINKNKNQKFQNENQNEKVIEKKNSEKEIKKLQNEKDKKNLQNEKEIKRENTRNDNIDNRDSIILDLGTKINKNYKEYNGFVILHPDIFLLHTISSLSFAFKNLSKPIIFLEKKKKIKNKLFDIRDCLIISSFFKIPEVCLFDNQFLYRGNRVSYNINKNYVSPNYPILGKIKNSIFEPHWQYIKIIPYLSKKLLFYYKNLNNVVLLKLNPMINYKKILNIFLDEKIRIIILSCYGAGNSPLNNKNFVDFIKKLLEKKKIIFSITQCLKGYIENTYENSIQKFGVLLGYDIIENTALAKMTYLSGLYKNDDILRKQSILNLRGEINENFLQIVRKGKDELKREIFNEIVEKEMILKSVRTNDINFLLELNSEFWKSDMILNIKTKEKKNILHLLSKNGDNKLINFLEKNILLKNLKIMSKEKDLKNNIPLYYAISYKNKKVYNYLYKISENQKIINKYNKNYIFEIIFESVENLDLDKIKLFYYSGVDFNNIFNFNKMNISHFAVFKNFKALLLFLKNDCLNFNFYEKDSYGKTSIDYIKELKRDDLKDIF